MEQLKAFFEKAKTDKELGEKFNALGSKGAGPDEYIALAAEYGFTVTMEEMDEEKKNRKLNEDQLEGVAGGGTSDKYNCWFTSSGQKKTMNGDIYIRCNSWWCGTPLETCKCWNNPQCEDAWHKVYADDLWLYPSTWANHGSKAPPKYGTVGEV